MGYTTEYCLSMWDENGKELPADKFYEVKAKLAKIFAVEDEFVRGIMRAIDDVCDGGYEMTWADHDKDMTELAKYFPNIKFELEGYGEDRGDWWIKQYWGDKKSESYAIAPLGELF